MKNNNKKNREDVEKGSFILTEDGAKGEKHLLKKELDLILILSY